MSTIKQTVKIQFDIAQHEYAVGDSDKDIIGDTYCYNGDEGLYNLEIYVDGEPLSEDMLENCNTTYTDYKTADLSEEDWGVDEEEIAYFGYYENEEHRIYEFETENFDLAKLEFAYECFDLKFDMADYEAESHWLTVKYDGVRLENHSDGCDCGSFEEVWYMYDEEDVGCCDEDEENVNVNEDTEDVEFALKKKYDKVSMGGDIYYIKLNGKYGIADVNGVELISPRYDWMGDEFVEDISIVGYDGGGIGYITKQGKEIVSPKYSQACNFKNGYAAVSSKGKWGFIDKTGKEITTLIYDDFENFKDGKAKVELNGESFYIDTDGKRIG